MQIDATKTVREVALAIPISRCLARKHEANPLGH